MSPASLDLLNTISASQSTEILINKKRLLITYTTISVKFIVK